jgi:hypothetical protein
MKRIPKKFETSYVFKDIMTSIFSLLIQNENIEKLNNNTQLPYLFTNKPIPIKFKYLLKEKKCSDINSKISWLINSNQIPTSFSYNYKLISNTIDNSTLLIFQIEITNPNKIENNLAIKVINSCNKICIEMINNIEYLIQEINNKIYQYESDIINSSKEEIWNTFKNLNHYLKINKKIKNYIIEGNNLEIGTKITVIFIDNTSVKYLISYLNNDNNKKKWEIEVIPLENELEKQAIRLCLIEISKEKCFIYIYHVFNEMPSLEVMKELELKKKNMITIIKNFLENKEK